MSDTAEFRFFSFSINQLRLTEKTSDTRTELSIRFCLRLYLECCMRHASTKAETISRNKKISAEHGVPPWKGCW